MSRARANWRRVAVMRNKMYKGVEALRYVQSWKAPLVSLGAMLALVLLSFSPHIIISLVLLSLACYAWVTHTRSAGAPLPMESDPEAEEDNAEVSLTFPLSHDAWIVSGKAGSQLLVGYHHLGLC